MGEPTYRGIYTYDDANKPANPPKSSPMYRGIYAYNAANKPAVQSAEEPEDGEEQLEN